MSKQEKDLSYQPSNQMVKDEKPSMAELAGQDSIMRFAVVFQPSLEAGAAANAAAIVTGGLRCEGFGAPIFDADGHAHAAIQWNLVVLKAKSSAQLKKLLVAAKERSVQAVAFSQCGQGLSNSFSIYKEEIERQHTEELDVLAVGLFGLDSEVRSLTRSLSLFK